jgi:hypothetical protein
MNKYGFIDDGRVYLKGFLNYPDREIGTVLLTDEKAIEYFQDRFLKLIEKIDQLQRDIDSVDNKGSFLMKIVHLQDSLATYNALGDFDNLYNRLESLKESLSKDVDVNRERNLALKNELLIKLKSAIAQGNSSEIEDEVKELHRSWLRIGRVSEENEEDLEISFKEVTDLFFENIRLEKERERELLYLKIDKYKSLHNQAKDLFYERKYDENKKAFIKIQQEWKVVGIIPKDKFFRINRDFRKLGNKYFERLNEEVKYMRERSPSERSGLEVKKRIYERSKVVYDLSSDEAFQLVKLIQDEWKESGFVPKKMAPAMFNDFYKNCEYAYERKNFSTLMVERFGTSDVALEDKKEVILELIEEAKKVVEEAESQMHLYKDRRDEDSKKFSSQLMVKKRKLEAKEIILDQLNNN